MASLTGAEIVYVQGVDGNGQPAASLEPTTTGAIASLSSANPKTYAAVGASTTAVIGGKYLLSAASGSVLTLPAAKGTGGSVEVIVSTTVTSNSHKVLAASTSDNLQGTIFTEDSGTTTGWYAALSSTYASLQLNGTTTSGYQGDKFTFIDLATNVWQVNGYSKSTGTAATPFSTADS
jgi:hypothetical protein